MVERVVVKIVMGVAFVALAGFFAGSLTLEPAGNPLPADVDGLVRQNDANSGRDAPNDASSDVGIVSGAVYEGTLTGRLGDAADWYRFEAATGDVVQLRIFSPRGCLDLFSWALVDGTGRRQSSSCGFLPDTGLMQFDIDATGPWWLVHDSPWFLLSDDLLDDDPTHVDRYRFSIGINEPAGKPFLG